MGPPVSERKLSQEELWETRKEILGWAFDGIQRTIELAPEKCEKLQQTILDAIQHSRKNPKGVQEKRKTTNFDIRQFRYCNEFTNVISNLQSQ